MRASLSVAAFCKTQGPASSALRADVSKKLVCSIPAPVRFRSMRGGKLRRTYNYASCADCE